MDPNGLNSDEPAPPGTSPPPILRPAPPAPPIEMKTPETPKPGPSAKGVENAKKRLRAFSIQKKNALSPIIPKPISTGNTTVLIGKLASVKTTPKVEVDDQKKPPKPPKPGSAKRCFQDSYTHQQKRTIGDIEDMKRKMELVDLGIPLGLICPTSTSEKAMPTKAMPPIKSFLGRRFRVFEDTQEKLATKRHKKRSAHHPAKVDELIREGKKARFEGREFKFDYQKLLPDYDNPFQRKRDDEKDHKISKYSGFEKWDKSGKKSRKSDRNRRHSDYRKDDRDTYRERSRDKSKDRFRNKDEKKESTSDIEKTTEKDSDVNLKDFLICDSWSLENEGKTNSPKHKTLKTPDKRDVENKLHDKIVEKDPPQLQPDVQIKQQLQESHHKTIGVKEFQIKKKDLLTESAVNSPRDKPKKIEKLQPVIDCFKFEIDPQEDDEILDIFDENCDIEKYSQVKSTKAPSRVSPLKDSILCEAETSKDVSMDGMNDDTFLESVINEIRQDDNMSDETSQDKRLVEYDESPIKEDYDSPAKNDSKQKQEYRTSVTPELDEKMKLQTKQKSDSFVKNQKSKPNSEASDTKTLSTPRGRYSDGRQSSESGYKTSDTIESNPKFDYRLSIEKELDEPAEKKMPASTMESLETWSFVLKICQPLLFRHDKNKCYRETQTTPKVWYIENPKRCSCVKDRAIVYDELEMLKMSLVDNLYGCDQIPDTPFVNARSWYPRGSACLVESKVQPVASEWEADDSQQEIRKEDRKRRSMTPQRNEEIMLDREYQRFMEAVWPDVAEAKAPETSRSTTPVQQQESRRKKKEDEVEKGEEDKKAKKIKLSSEGWSQESDIEEEVEKGKKLKVKDKDKTRKRKRSTSTLSSISDDDASAKKKRKLIKKKALKKAKSKNAKRRRMGKKILKKLKEKQKQKKKTEKQTEELEMEQEKKSEVKKSKKKKTQKLKRKKNQKRRKRESSSSSTDSSSSSTSTSSYSSSDSDSDRHKKRKAGGKRKRQRRRKASDRSENLFDVNILNNIKTERLTDDEKNQKLLEFSPRAHTQNSVDTHKPREIINVKELQKDFVGNSIQIKKEAVESVRTEKKIQEKEASVPNLDRSGVLPPLPVGPPTPFAMTTPLMIPPVINTSVSPAVINASVTPVVIKTHVVTPAISTSVVTPAEARAPIVATAIASSAAAIRDETVNLRDGKDTAKVGGVVRILDESNMSQSSSQESVCSVKEIPVYEKDESHLRPSSHNSNYSFNDVIASQNELYQKAIETTVDTQDKYTEGYEHETESYEMYEQLAMAYQSDVANQACGAQERLVSPQRIETVVRARARGEIKCDWRADRAAAAPPATRPSRWGLAPSDVNIVLTGGEQSPHPGSPPTVYRIQSLANRSDVTADYDEAYMDTYGASDRLQYGDCFATDTVIVDTAVATLASVVQADLLPLAQTEATEVSATKSTLDARIDQALRETVLGEVAKESEPVEEQTDIPEKGILVTTFGASESGRGVKRVSFADGYKPGQDSDIEDPPVKKRRRARRSGCAWPCPATHPDHVPLWDALPPPPPPPGDPPPPPATCRRAMQDSGKPLMGFMPPEPPPGLISF